MWPQLLSHLGMQLKVWFVRKTSIPFRTNSCVYLCKFIVPSAVLLSECQNGKKNVITKELRDWRKKGNKDREPKCSHYSVKFAARWINMREQQLVKQRTFCYVTSIGCLQTMNTYSSQFK